MKTKIEVDDLIEINKNLVNIEMIVKKYGLEIDDSLFYLTIFNNKKYPTNLIRKPLNVPNIEEFNNFKTKYINKKTKKMLPYISNRYDIESVMKYYLNKNLLPTGDKRQWISIKKILYNFAKWYQDMYNERLDMNIKMYEMINKVFNNFGIIIKGSRINGYELQI